MKVSDIMSKEVNKTGTEATLQETLELMEKQSHNGLVVVEGEKSLG
jgi:CBS domain-containing protein